ncbi:hypothetical protein LTS18_010327, partial [Coniosporium uncinatum]
QVYKDGFAWFEAVGREKGKKDAGVEVLRLSEENWSGAHEIWQGKKKTNGGIEKEVRTFGRELRRLLGAT